MPGSRPARVAKCRADSGSLVSAFEPRSALDRSLLRQFESPGARAMDVTPQAGRYRVIYADPPWRFATYSDKGKGRSAEAHYDCLSLDDIKAFPVAAWAAPDAVLLLWATDPLLPRALEVIQAWGFAYKTVGFYWIKLNKWVEGRLSREWPLLGGRDFFTGLG